MSAHDRLEYLRTARGEGCTRCPLHRKRNRLVFGAGDPNAAIVVVGEAPGDDENRTGEPFTGPAGELLDGFFRRVGLRREETFIMNMVKCHPDGNRDPSREEIHACVPFLHLQLAIIQPRVILAVGGIAGRYLSGQGEDAAVGYLRKHDWLYRNDTTGLQVPLVVTYHPSYILRNKNENPGAAKDAAKKVVADLGKVLRLAE